MIRCEDISHSYGTAGARVPVLEGLDLRVSAGETCVLLGPSGSGKSTLLAILGCLLTPEKGTYQLAGTLVPFEEPERLANYRAEKLGFVFQHAQLLPFLDALSNVAIVAENQGRSRSEAFSSARALLDRVGLAAEGNRFPDQLSGGQRQRVAVARAMIHRPSVILADEPTASLDWNHGREVLTLFLERVKEDGGTLVVVTHDQRMVPHFDRAYELEQGRLVPAPSA